MNRRGFITGLSTLIAAPAIIKLSSLMPVKSYADWDGRGDLEIIYQNCYYGWEMYQKKNGEWVKVAEGNHAGRLYDGGELVHARHTLITENGWKFVNGVPVPLTKT